MEALLTADGLIALLTLCAMEIVLGIDNIVFIAILVARLPQEQQDFARNLGISLALILRLALLFAISWIMSLTQPLFSILAHTFSGRDLILLVGGLFLLAKATREIHVKVEGDGEDSLAQPHAGAFGMVLLQILLLDVVFSLDSVITAVGMADEIAIMVVAMVIAVGMMLASASAISRFVETHPTIKILALSFLMLIGVMLTAEGMGAHLSKGYIYFAMGFSLLVELLNMRYRSRRSKAAA